MPIVCLPPPARHRNLILGAICLAALVLPMSFTGGAVATPAIGQAFAATPAALAWITNAFMLSFGSLLMAAGALADRYGRKRFFVGAMAMFALVSLLLSTATSIVWIDLLRAAQGLAAAAALSSGSAALAQVFEGRSQTRAFSVLGATFGVGLAFGPMACGALIEHWGWRALFVATAMLAGASLLLTLPLMTESRDSSAQPLDLGGMLTFSAALATFTTAIILAPESGWTSATVAALLGASVLCLAAFILVERRAPWPMLDLGLFAFPRFIGVQLLPIGTCYCYIVLIMLLPLRLIGIEGASAFEAGLMSLALSAPLLVVPLVAAMLTRWCSPAGLCATGFLIAATGLYWLSTLVATDGHTTVAALLLIGTGTALPWGLMDGLAMSVVPKQRAGMAAGIFNTARVAGEGVALAVCIALLGALVADELALSAPSTPGLANLAQRLVMGDIDHAASPIPVDVLRSAYEAGFNRLLRGLAVFTVLTAGVIFVFLREREGLPQRRQLMESPRRN